MTVARIRRAEALGIHFFACPLGMWCPLVQVSDLQETVLRSKWKTLAKCKLMTRRRMADVMFLLSHALSIVLGDAAAGGLIVGKGCGWFLDNECIMHEFLYDCSLIVANLAGAPVWERVVDMYIL